MVHDFEYFADFLANPSAPELNGFFRMVRLWVKYVDAHKDDFNYLEDDEWKEIRERLLAELEIRMAIKDDLSRQFQGINQEIEDLPDGSFEEAIAIFKQRLEFMKTYQDVFDISDEEVCEFERLIEQTVKSLAKVRAAQENARVKKLEHEQSIADLDDEMFKYYERTGKIPMLPVYRDKKHFKGN